MQTVNVTDMLVKSLVCLTVFLMTLALGGYASAEMLKRVRRRRILP